MKIRESELLNNWNLLDRFSDEFLDRELDRPLWDYPEVIFRFSEELKDAEELHEEFPGLTFEECLCVIFLVRAVGSLLGKIRDNVPEEHIANVGFLDEKEYARDVARTRLEKKLNSNKE